MSRFWHGYVAFQKPSGVDSGAWDTALANLKTELDETPTADQPSERWHTVTNGDTTIAEGVFNLSKLTTTNLTSVAGVDMTDAWEMLRPYQGIGNSRSKAHSLIDDRGWDLNGYTDFYPEDYGTVDGDPENDTAAVQAAIEAAISNYDSTGELSRVNGQGNTYQIQQSGLLDAGIVNSYYGLLIDGDGVGLENCTLELAVLPEVGIFAIIVVGNGGSEVGLPGENGTWRYTNWLKDISIDGSSFTEEERESFSTSGFSSTITFLYTQDFICRNVIIIDGWGGTGVLCAQASCRNGVLIENDIQSAVSGIRQPAFSKLDGGRNILVIGNISQTKGAIRIQQNGDNTDYALGITAGKARECAIINNTFTNLGGVVSADALGIGILGADDCVVYDNILSSGAGKYVWPIVFTPASRAGFASSTCSRAKIAGNSFTTIVATNRPIDFIGLDDDENTPEENDPIYIEDGLIEDNAFVGFNYRAWFRDSYCRNMVFQNNTFGDATDYGYANAEDEEIIVANNTLQ